ncbi:MAG: hypothetical protein EXS29_04845 [Pedosphaera sp.]|nr:hypothetical protein [Pedosphaera sp.]MST00621.1 hypothetical protein [Pedosphaera sp.]
MKRLLAQLSLTAIAACAAPLEPLPASKPNPIFIAPAPSAPKETFVYTDKPALILVPLVSPSAARAVTERFQAAYTKLGQPRLLIRVNPQPRTLTNPNAPAAPDPVKQEEPPAEVRELPPLFTRLFQQAGGRVLEKETSAEPAEIAIEVLAATRRLVVREVSGDRVHLVPELQLAAVRLADGRLLAQVSVGELFGADAEAARLLRHFKLTELAEAAALRLMEELASAR